MLPDQCLNVQEEFLVKHGFSTGVQWGGDSGSTALLGRAGRIFGHSDS